MGFNHRITSKNLHVIDKFHFRFRENLTMGRLRLMSVTRAHC